MSRIVFPDLDPLFAPREIAVVGASANPRVIVRRAVSRAPTSTAPAAICE